MSEYWKPVPGYNGKYEVSNLGKVRSFAMYKEGIILKQSITKKGYYWVRLSGKFKSIHRLVAESFIGFSKLQVNHKDMDKSNNRVDNLEYVSCKQNIRHAYLNGRPPASIGESHYRAKLTEKEVLEIRELALKKVQYKEIAKNFNISIATVCAIKTKRIWRHI